MPERPPASRLTTFSPAVACSYQQVGMMWLLYLCINFSDCSVTLVLHQQEGGQNIFLTCAVDDGRNRKLPLAVRKPIHQSLRHSLLYMHTSSSATESLHCQIR